MYRLNIGKLKNVYERFMLHSEGDQNNASIEEFKMN